MTARLPHCRQGEGGVRMLRRSCLTCPQTWYCWGASHSVHVGSRSNDRTSQASFWGDHPFEVEKVLDFFCLSWIQSCILPCFYEFFFFPLSWRRHLSIPHPTEKENTFILFWRSFLSSIVEAGAGKGPLSASTPLCPRSRGGKTTNSWTCLFPTPNLLTFRPVI